MSVNQNKYLQPPISIADLQNLFGLSSNDLATLINDAVINPWARWKPIIYPNATGCLTQQQFVEKSYGLVPQVNSLALQVCASLNPTPHYIGQSGYSFDSVASAMKNWTYQKPTGGMGAPYRLADFADPNNHGANGYNHFTPAPCDFQQWDIMPSDLNNLANNFPKPTMGSDGSDPANTVITAIDSVLYQNFQMRFGDGSGDTIGYTESDIIPLSQILSGLNTKGNWYRIGVLIQYQQYLYLVVSRATIWEYYNSNDSKIKGNVAYLMPALETNCNFVLTLQKYYQQYFNKSNLTLQGLPCIVKNAILTVNSNRSTVQLNSDSVIYSPPSNSHQIDVNILSSSNPEIDTPPEQVHSRIFLRSAGSTILDGTQVTLYDLVLSRDENGSNIAYDYTWSCTEQGGRNNYRFERNGSDTHTFGDTEREYVIVNSVPFITGTLRYSITRRLL